MGGPVTGFIRRKAILGLAGWHLDGQSPANGGPLLVTKQSGTPLGSTTDIPSTRHDVQPLRGAGIFGI